MILIKQTKIRWVWPNLNVIVWESIVKKKDIKVWECNFFWGRCFCMLCKLVFFWTAASLVVWNLLMTENIYFYKRTEPVRMTEWGRGQVPVSQQTLKATNNDGVMEMTTTQRHMGTEGGGWDWLLNCDNHTLSGTNNGDRRRDHDEDRMTATTVNNVALFVQRQNVTVTPSQGQRGMCANSLAAWRRKVCSFLSKYQKVISNGNISLRVLMIPWTSVWNNIL